MGGADQWGNITAGLELIRRTSGAGEDAAAGARARLQAPAVAVGDEVRQERVGRVGLARSGADVAVRVLPVLAEHRRPRRRHLPALVHRAGARGDRGARGRLRARPEARAAQRALARDITTRTHGEAAAAQAIADSEALFSGGPIEDPGPRLALRVDRRVHVRRRLRWRRASPSCSPKPGVFASRGEARRMIAGGGVTINGSRVTDAGGRPGADRRGVARRPDRQAPAGDRPPAALGRLGGSGLERREPPRSAGRSVPGCARSGAGDRRADGVRGTCAARARGSATPRLPRRRDRRTQVDQDEVRDRWPDRPARLVSAVAEPLPFAVDARDVGSPRGVVAMPRSPP